MITATVICDLDLSPKMLKHKIIQIIVILNICMSYIKNQFIKENKSANSTCLKIGTLNLTLSLES